jgi:hypothetical protein
MRLALMVTLMTLSFGLAPLALADQTTPSRVEPRAAVNAARRYVAALHGGKWKANFLDWTHKGRAKVVVRAKNPLRRWLGARAQGGILVGQGGDIVGHKIHPGTVWRAGGAVCNGVCRAWNSQVVRDLRTSKNVITLAAAAAATWAATEFGFSYDQALTVAIPATTALLATDLKGRRQLRKAANRLADQLVDRYYPGTPIPPGDGTRAPVNPNPGLESMRSTPVQPAPRPSRAALKQQLSRQIRAELDL